MIKLEYFNGKSWEIAGKSWYDEGLAWISLGGDDFNYRTVDAETGQVLTDKSISLYGENGEDELDINLLL